MYYDTLNSEEQVSYLIKPILEVLQAAGGQLERSEIRDRISELDEHIAEFEQKLYTSNKTGNQYKKFDFKFNFAIKELGYVGLISYVKYNPQITLTQEGASVDLSNFDVKTEVRDKARTYWEEHSAKNKAKNKAMMQKEFGLEVKPDVPVVAMVSRLVAHKGFDLVKAVLEEIICTSDAQFIILGTGEWQFESFFKDIASRYPGRVSLTLAFRPDLASKIYAGSDIFLMPSKSEPCGLSQMIALRYGSIPVVRETGGLRDTVFDSGLGEGNGFTFPTYNAHDMMHALIRAFEGYADHDGWQILVKRAMSCDCSWAKSANEYIKMYKELIKG